MSGFSPVCLFSGFKLKHFLRDDETLTSFLRMNASFPEHSVEQIREADVHLDKVRTRSAHAQYEHILHMLNMTLLALVLRCS